MWKIIFMGKSKFQECWGQQRRPCWSWWPATGNTRQISFICLVYIWWFRHEEPVVSSLEGCWGWKTTEESDGCSAGKHEVLLKQQILSLWELSRCRNADNCSIEKEQAEGKITHSCDVYFHQMMWKKTSWCRETPRQTLRFIKVEVNLQCCRTGNPVKWPEVLGGQVNKSELKHRRVHAYTAQPVLVSHGAFICIKDGSMSTLVSVSPFIPQCFFQALAEFGRCLSLWQCQQWSLFSIFLIKCHCIIGTII